MNSIIAELSLEIAEYLEMHDTLWNKMSGNALIFGIDMQFQKTSDFIEIEFGTASIRIDRFTYELLPAQRL
ncbi:hypothetical protein [Sphingobium sp. B11D3A]|uniref:hypothetical protein n=1 Tax=Sphingobium sp. B11D3A TaxID=2940574 RepID=UPI002224FE2D|nr:hypothetical protein [Sphingobium sp. B11D3A]